MVFDDINNQDFISRYLENNGKDNLAEVSKVESTLLFSANNSDSEPIISICIPTYKRNDSLKKSILSVFNQKSQNNLYELVIVDNNPDEDGNALLPFLKENANCPIRYYVNKTNLGMFGNWNKCLVLAKGKWIGMLHDDDEIYEDYVNRITSIINKYKNDNIAYIKTNFDVCINGNMVKTKKLRALLEKLLTKKVGSFHYKDFLIEGNAGSIGAPTCGTIINKEAFSEVGGYCDKWGMSSDVYTPFLLMKQYKVCYCFRRMGIINYGENESCKDNTIREWLYDFLLFQKYLSSLNSKFRKFNDKYGEAHIKSFLRRCLLKQQKNILDVNEYKFVNDIYQIDNVNIKKLRKLNLIIKIHSLWFLMKNIFRNTL